MILKFKDFVQNESICNVGKLYSVSDDRYIGDFIFNSNFYCNPLEKFDKFYCLYYGETIIITP